MAQINDYTLLIDVTTGRLLRDPFSDVQIQPRPFVQGDVYNVRVCAVQPRPGRNVRRIWDYIPLPEEIYVAIGNVGERPESGSFTLIYDEDETTPLAHDATPAQVQTALNALASITAAGGVTVSGQNGGPYQVAFDDPGARLVIEANADALFPLSTIQIYTARDGTVDTSEIQIIAIDRLPAALADTFTALPSAAGSVERLQGGGTGVPEIQRVSISPDAYEGTYTLTFGGDTSTPIPFNATAEDLQALLEDAFGAGNILVLGDGPSWDITFQGTLTGAQALLTVDVSGILVPIGRQGLFNLATAGIESLVAGSEAAISRLEVVAVTEDGQATILQTECTVINDGIQNAPAMGPTLPSYLTEAQVIALVDPILQSAVRVVTGGNWELSLDVDVTNSTTFTESGFNFQATEGTIYRITCWLKVANTAAMQGKCRFVVPTGSTILGPTSIVSDSVVVSASPFIDAAAGFVFFDSDGSSTEEMVRLDFMLTAGADGDVIFEFAQQTAVPAETLSLLAGSRILAEIVPVF